jgi:polyisoprenoid-binding protein YceI
MRFAKLIAVVVLGWMVSVPVMAGDTYKVDPVHSSVLFRVRHMNVSEFYGRFADVSGTVTVDDADPSKSSFDVSIKTESIDSFNEKRDQHLRGPDFFSAKEFPTISFKSTSVKKVTDTTWEVTGDLTLHGVTRSITVSMEKTGAGSGPQGGAIVGFETVFTIKRTDYGMSNMLKGIGDDVRIIVAIEAGKR